MVAMQAAMLRRFKQRQDAAAPDTVAAAGFASTCVWLCGLASSSFDLMPRRSSRSASRTVCGFTLVRVPDRPENATVGRATVLFYGTNIQPRCTVAPHSVVMKNETLSAGRTYTGVPTEYVGTEPGQEPTISDAGQAGI